MRSVMKSLCAVSLSMRMGWCAGIILLSPLVSYGRPGPTFEKGEDPCPEGMRWVPVEELTDEFNGTKLDLDKWQPDPIGNGWGWLGRPPALFPRRNGYLSARVP